MSDAPRVLVIEDDAALRQALDVALRRSGYAVRITEHGEGLADDLDGFRPDLAVIDVHLRTGPDGFVLGQHIRSRSDIPMLFLTARTGISDRLRGFEVGGDDYVTKPFSLPELLARIDALLRRAGRLESAVLTIGPLVVDPGLREIALDGTAVELTPTEFDLLLVLAQRRGRVVSKQRLLALVWGFEHYDPNVVEVHVSSLRRKLQEAGPRLIHTVRGAGYVLRA